MPTDPGVSRLESKSSVFSMLERMDTHLDSRVSEVYKEQPLAQDWGRVAKVGEEFGEAIDALIAYTGQNPHKGVCGERSALLDELADVVMTAMLAIQHFTKDARQTQWLMENKARHIYDRMIEWENRPVTQHSDPGVSQTTQGDSDEHD